MQRKKDVAKPRQQKDARKDAKEAANKDLDAKPDKAKDVRGGPKTIFSDARLKRHINPL